MASRNSGAPSRRLLLLSRALLILGSTLLLGGAGYWLWSWLHAPPPPIISEAGAVVVAQTALPPATRTATPEPALTLAAGRTEGLPTPALLPGWEVSEEEPLPTAISAASPIPRPSPTPSPTPLPAAGKPPTRIVAPAIGLDAKVVPMSWKTVDSKGTMVSVWVVPKKAAGWHVNSALPGHGGNVVISGHHNIEGKVFRYVVDLKPGDEITLYVADTAYPYVVTEKYILKEAGMPLSVRQKNAQWIMPTQDERLTLVTCWPYEWPGNTHRVIVVARPPDSAPETEGGDIW